MKTVKLAVKKIIRIIVFSLLFGMQITSAITLRQLINNYPNTNYFDPYKVYIVESKKINTPFPIKILKTELSKNGANKYFAIDLSASEMHGDCGEVQLARSLKLNEEIPEIYPIYEKYFNRALKKYYMDDLSITRESNIIKLAFNAKVNLLYDEFGKKIIVMPRIEGESLQDFSRSKLKFYNDEQKKYLGADILASGLNRTSSLFKQNVLHQDIHSKNVIVQITSQPRVVRVHFVDYDNSCIFPVCSLYGPEELEQRFIFLQEDAFSLLGLASMFFKPPHVNSLDSVDKILQYVKYIKQAFNLISPELPQVTSEEIMALQTEITDISKKTSAILHQPFSELGVLRQLRVDIKQVRHNATVLVAKHLESQELPLMYDPDLQSWDGMIRNSPDELKEHIQILQKYYEVVKQAIKDRPPVFGEGKAVPADLPIRLEHIGHKPLQLEGYAQPERPFACDLLDQEVVY